MGEKGVSMRQWECHKVLYVDVCLLSLPLVCSDLLQNPLIVPVKVLSGHQVVDKIGGYSLILHCLLLRSMQHS